VIEIKVTKANAVCVGGRELLTTGRVGLGVKLVFSPDWTGLIQTAVCYGSGRTIEVAVGADGTFSVPHECMQVVGSALKIGVCGMNADGTVVIPTVYCALGVIQKGALPSGETGEEPTPSAFNQLMAIAQEAIDVAQTARTEAQAARDEAATSAETADKANDAAAAQAETATAAARAAAASEAVAQTAAGNAQASEQAAGQYSQSASEQTAAAEKSARNATASEEQAAVSATNAKASETAAAASAAAAAKSAVAAQSAADSFSTVALLGLRIVDGLLCCVCAE
jgi:hypothetical protein